MPNDFMGFIEKLAYRITRKRTIQDKIEFKGVYPLIEHYRNGKLLKTYRIENGVTNQGKDYILNAGFNSGTQVAAGSWCIGFIDNTSFSALAAADTPASHAGWIEFTGYSQANRVAWGQGSSSGQSVTNGTPVTIDVTAAGTLAGIFVISQNTKGGTTGILWATGAFPGTPPTIAIGDEFKVIYGIAC